MGGTKPTPRKVLDTFPPGIQKVLDTFQKQACGRHQTRAWKMQSTTQLATRGVGNACGRSLRHREDLLRGCRDVLDAGSSSRYLNRSSRYLLESSRYLVASSRYLLESSIYLVATTVLNVQKKHIFCIYEVVAKNVIFAHSQPPSIINIKSPQNITSNTKILKNL